MSGSVLLKADAGEDQFSEEGKQVILNAENTRVQIYLLILIVGYK